MGVAYAEPLTTADVTTSNDGCRGYSPLRLVDAESLSGYFGVKTDTVRRWFRAGSYGVCPRRMVGETLSENAPASADDSGSDWQRAILAITLGAAGGLTSTSIYDGKYHEFIQTADTLGDAIYFISSLLAGEYDDPGDGFRWGESWDEITISPNDDPDTAGYWAVHIWYNSKPQGPS